MPRYLKAIQIRLTRLANDPQKDAKKAVSLFAPELKTAYPVSVQRVERMFG